MFSCFFASRNCLQHFFRFQAPLLQINQGLNSETVLRNRCAKSEAYTNRRTKSDSDTQDKQTYGHGHWHVTAHDSTKEQSRHTRRHTAQNSTTHHSTPQRNPLPSPSLLLSHSLTHSLSLSLTLSLSHSLSLSLTHSLSLSLTLSHSHSLSLSLTLTHSLSLSHFPAPLSLSHPSILSLFHVKNTQIMTNKNVAKINFSDGSPVPGYIAKNNRKNKSPVGNHFGLHGTWSAT